MCYSSQEYLPLDFYNSTFNSEIVSTFSNIEISGIFQGQRKLDRESGL